MYMLTQEVLSLWVRLPDCAFRSCSSAIVSSFLTLIGGYHNGLTTNKLFSLTRKYGGEWVENFHLCRLNDGEQAHSLREQP